MGTERGKAKILVVEDEKFAGEIAVKQLSEDYRVTLARNIAEAEAAVHTESFDLILLDVQLPDGDGFHFCSKLRSGSLSQRTPIIFLTGQAEPDDRILGLTVGADDYLTKPYYAQELRLRISAVLKRTKEPETPGKTRFGDIVLDLRYHEASILAGEDREAVQLTALEFKILYFLASRDGAVCSRQEIIQEIWGSKVHVTERTIDTHLANLRKKIAKSEWTILSVHGFGYHWTRKDRTRKPA